MPKLLLNAFARMARASRLTREEAEARLRDKAPEAELKAVLDQAYAEDPDVLAGAFIGGAELIKPVTSTGEGKNIDEQGRDEADRAALAVMQAMDKDQL
jgi:hypothetical protein